MEQGKNGYAALGSYLQANATLDLHQDELHHPAGTSRVAVLQRIADQLAGVACQEDGTTVTVSATRMGTPGCQ